MYMWSAYCFSNIFSKQISPESKNITLRKGAMTLYLLWKCCVGLTYRSATGKRLIIVWRVHKD